MIALLIITEISNCQSIIASLLLCNKAYVQLFNKRQINQYSQHQIDNLDYSTLFSDLFAEYTTSSKLLRVKTVNMGSLYSLHYRVTLKDTDKEKELLDAMRCRNGNLEISCGIAADGRQGEAL